MQHFVHNAPRLSIFDSIVEKTPNSDCDEENDLYAVGTANPLGKL